MTKPEMKIRIYDTNVSLFVEGRSLLSSLLSSLIRFRPTMSYDIFLGCALNVIKLNFFDDLRGLTPHKDDTNDNRVTLSIRNN